MSNRAGPDREDAALTAGRAAAPWAFAAAVESGRLDLPLPGYGRDPGERFAALADLAGEDLSLARLGEGHADAVAILAELLGGPATPGQPVGSMGGVPAGSQRDSWK